MFCLCSFPIYFNQTSISREDVLSATCTMASTLDAVVSSPSTESSQVGLAQRSQRFIPKQSQTLALPSDRYRGILGQVPFFCIRRSNVPHLTRILSNITQTLITIFNSLSAPWIGHSFMYFIPM